MVVEISDSPVKPPLKAKGVREVALVGETATGEKLAPGKVLVKDEELGRLLPRFGVPSVKNLEGDPLVIFRPALGMLAPAPEKKEKPFLLSLPPLDLEGKEEKDKKSKEEEGSKLGEVAQGKKECPFLTVPAGTPGIEGPGDMMEEAAKEKGETLPAVPSVVFGEEIWGTLGDRLSEIRRVEEKILRNTSETLEVVRTLKGKEDVEARCLREVREPEGALSQATKRSLADQREQLGKVFHLEDRLASLAQANAEWASKIEIARGEFNRNLADVNQAHSAHVKDLQKRIKDLDDDREALREERRRLREELTKAREALSRAKEAASEARLREELSRSEIRSLRALVENSSGWRGRRMEDLEEAVKWAVKIVSSSPVGRHTQRSIRLPLMLF
ncbi:hypothetical protein AXF42_Ash001114 [Apostasia shenzhenica]|uniref:Uncharacterized protein n=1 Tax=Apostasia shenzhenica TaxID=1088818 RepID=A0A2I0ATZ3_9ASPA|nr:hypothetical protein AXF42_Ash001114 [Apostasia shenzhenica]